MRDVTGLSHWFREKIEVSFLFFSLPTFQLCRNVTDIKVSDCARTSPAATPRQCRGRQLPESRFHARADLLLDHTLCEKSAAFITRPQVTGVDQSEWGGEGGGRGVHFLNHQHSDIIEVNLVWFSVCEAQL